MSRNDDDLGPPPKNELQFFYTLLVLLFLMFCWLFYLAINTRVPA